MRVTYDQSYGHMYMEIWCADIGEELSYVKEIENYYDLFVALLKCFK